MKQPNYYTQALAYLRDYCLRHDRLMHYSAGDIFETEGAAARLFGYIESGSFHYLVRNYEGGESTVETVAAGDLVGCYPYCLDGDAAPVTIRADKPSTVYVVDGADLEEHYRQSQAAERMGRDYMAYRLEQVKSQIYSHYCEKGVRDV
ncbi:MAG: cyclic nucleotide-binding domain-containing protein [Prevotella sp.]|nr:cyclic nucleotide-binding domain-containing protein [Prevotella sp.]